MTVLVIGARGRIGKGVVDGLRAHGVDVRPASSGDLGDLDALGTAFTGATRLFLYANPATAATMSAAADAAGVEHVVVLSSAAARENPDDRHAVAERDLTTGNYATTVLQPGAFLTNMLRWIPGIRATGEVRLPYLDIEEAPIDERDIADAAVRVFLDGPDKHTGAQYLLTGPRSLTRRSQIELIGEITGLPARPVEQTPEQWRADMAQQWGPNAPVDSLLAYWAARVGRTHEVHDAQRITGRPARTVQTWLTDNAAEFTR